MIVILCKEDSIVEVIDMAYGNIIINVSIKCLEGDECTRAYLNTLARNISRQTG